MLRSLGRLLDVREGDGRIALVLSRFAFLAGAVVLSAIMVATTGWTVRPP